MSVDWKAVAKSLMRIAKDPTVPLDDGQRASLMWMAERLPQSGLILADEVGTGKTRIACAVVHSVLKAGGRAAVVIPHGLMHQWHHEARFIGVPEGKAFTSLRDFIDDAKSNEWEKIAPAPGTSEWLLVSHGFRAPQVRQSQWPAEWRVALPSYVLAGLSSASNRYDGRTYAGRLLNDPHDATQGIAEDITRLVTGDDRRKLRELLVKLPLFRRGGDNAKLIDALQNEGRKVVEELLGLWLGEFDLIVIDEAHKGRGEVDVEGVASDAVCGSVISRLVGKLLKQPETGRRLCLTATPMELELEQWIDLLERARGVRIDPDDPAQKAIKCFREATKSAAIAPDEGELLGNLCKAAGKFEKALRDYVTRRRRDEGEFIQKFSAKLSDEKRHKSSRPHRNVSAIPIAWTKTVGKNSPWFAVLFATECMSQSALGLNRRLFESAIQLLDGSSDKKKQKRLKYLIRDMYSRLASGHISADIFDEDARIAPPDDCDDVIRGKLKRTEYWRSKIQMAMSAGLHEDEHPRILAAVKEIESWTLKREKVLVFGVFLRPLRLLRDVLNVRHALRAADAGRPIAHAVHADAALLKIARRQLECLRADGALSGHLSTGNGAEMLRALADSHKIYKDARKDVRERAKEVINAWWNDSSLLDGAPDDRKHKRALEDHLVSFVVDDFLATTSESNKVADERFDRLAIEFVENHLRPLLGELGDEDADEKQAMLRQKALRSLLEDDDGRQSFHARLLQGDTRWETRRYLQAAFNRPGASPWVFIAQSQVGREGLNLHESCRVVVQFHAEWNPAVLEQQIGRVDRKGSLWEQRAQKWLADGAQSEPPYIEVRQLIFEGTYDAFKWDRVMRRQHVFDASLFGSLLPIEALEKVPPDRLQDVLDAAPSFSPLKECRGQR